MLLETQVKMKQDQGQIELTAADIAPQIQELIENDPLVRSLREDIRRYEYLIRDGQATMLDTNPEMKRRREILQELQAELENKRQEVSVRMEQKALADTQRARQAELDNLQTQLNQAVAYEEKLRQQLAAQDASTISIGRTQLDIDDLREQYDSSRQIYNEITRRIDELNIERDRQPRISVGSWARSISTEGKKKKLAGAAAFGGLAFGLALAVLLAKLDRRVHAPDEVARRIGVRIIGTTTGPDHVSRKLLGQQLADDYQTIRANLGLLDGNGSTKILVVTSPGMGDGKSTLAINLATSFARSGRKTLLIDGDLRKPDIASMLNLPTTLRGIQDYLFGADLQKAIYPVDGMELSVLASDARNSQDALELLSIPETPERIRRLRDTFDYIIIDTPPVLAFSDAMVWARMADGVIMTSYIGHTSKVEMKEALKRLQDMKANIIGTVVNNVKTSHSYRRYGYGYGYGYSEKEKAARKPRNKRGSSVLLIGAAPESDDSQSKDA
jgi:capsular exopolysaccharide synthesis family protein